MVAPHASGAVIAVSTATKAFAAKDVRERIDAQGFTLPLGTLKAFAAHIAVESKRWEGVIGGAGLGCDAGQRLPNRGYRGPSELGQGIDLAD